MRVADLDLDFRPEELKVLTAAYEHALAEIGKDRRVDAAAEAELGKLVLVEARRRLRLGLRLDNLRDAEVLAFMASGSFFG